VRVRLRKSCQVGIPTAAWRPAIRRRAWRSLSVHRLLLISSDLMLSAARAEMMDDFFAMIALSVRMNPCAARGAGVNQSELRDCTPALLFYISAGHIVSRGFDRAD